MSEESVPTEPLTQECPSCGALIDISDEDPLALIHCPSCGEAMRVRRTFGNFELLEVLGAGGMGAVYRAQDLTLGRSVALKLLRREYSEHPEVTQQFEHEAALTALINHPNVVKVYSTGSDHGLFYIAMELVDKGSLDDLMTLQNKVSEAQVLQLGVQVAQGLRAAAQSGLMHRDVKPGNILFADANQAKIVDFGLAAPLDEGAGMAGEIWGTPYYVAPEKLDHPPQEDFRSDIYSLGATLFHALAGRPPYEAKDASMVALKHLKSQPVSLQAFAPGVSTGTAYVINRALHKDPSKRYQTYDELIQHLEYARQQLMTKVSQPRRAAARVQMESKGQQWAMSFITLVMVALMVGGGYYLYTQRERFFPQKKKPVVVVDSGATDRNRYEEARKLIVRGEPEKAVALLRALESEGKLTEPTLSWTTFHAGLAALMASQREEATIEFEKLAKRGKDATGDNKLLIFLGQLATFALGDQSGTEEQAKQYNHENYEAIGPLLMAVKTWDLGEFETALKIFDEYRSVYPKDPDDDWIRQYRDLIPEYFKNYEAYKGFAADLAKFDNEPAKAKAELPKLKERRDALKLKGALAKKGQSALRKLEQQVDDYDAEQLAASKDMEGIDLTTIAEADAKLKPMAQEFKFKEAVAEVKKVAAITDKGKKAKSDLLKKYDWLVSFKAQLVSDFGVRGYPGGLVRKQGLAVGGTINDADEAELIVSLPNSKETLKVKWTDVTVDHLFNIGRAYLTPDLPADRLADRMWYLGVFSDFFGKKKEAAALFKAAIGKKPGYQAELSVFPDAEKAG